MKKVNFDGLNHIKAPQDWIEKAAIIPKNSAKKRVLTIPYRVVAAASLTLVSTIAVVMLMLFGGRHIPTNGDIPISAQTQSETPSADITSQAFPTQTLVEESTSAGEELSAPTTGTRVSMTPNGTGAPKDPNTAPTVSSAITPSSTTAPTVTPANRTEPTVHSATETLSAQDPTQPSETMPQTHPTLPTDPTLTPVETEPPTYGFEDMDLVSVAAVFPAELITDGEPIYCIVQPRGYAGATVNDRFADHRKAHYMVMKNGNVFAGYDAEPSPLNKQKAVTYDYFFYNSRGELLSQGSTTKYPSLQAEVT